MILDVFSIDIIQNYLQLRYHSAAMKKAATVLVAVMIVLAGCGGSGGGTTSPTEDSSETPTLEGEIDMEQPSDPSNLSTMAGEESDAFANATQFNVTLYNGTSEDHLVRQIDRDSGRQLLDINSSEYGTGILYNSSEYIAIRDTTTGEEAYGTPSSGVGFGLAFASLAILGTSVEYASLTDWEPAGTTTVNGEAAFVYESDSLNESAFDSGRIYTTDLEQADVQSVNSRMVISPEGQIHSIEVAFETQDGTYGTNMTVQYDDITISQPSWVNESRAP
jgi:hypothetical protein